MIVFQLVSRGIFSGLTSSLKIYPRKLVKTAVFSVYFTLRYTDKLFEKKQIELDLELELKKDVNKYLIQKFKYLLE